MKFSWLAVAIGLAAFTGAPSAFPQTQNPSQNPPQTQTPTTDPDEGQPKAGDVQNAPKQAPAALPTQEDSQIKHNGGKK